MEISFSEHEYDDTQGKEREQLRRDANPVLIKLLQEIPSEDEEADDPRESSTGRLHQYGHACIDFTDKESLASIRTVTAPTMAPLSRDYSDDEILWFVREAKSGRRRSESAARTIYAGAPETIAVAKAVAVLPGIENVFQRAGALCRMVWGVKQPGIERPENAPSIVEHGQASLRELLSGAATWLNGKGKPALVPSWVAPMVLERDVWPGVPPLTGIIEAPTLRADGTIITRKGVDAATGLFLTEDWSLPPMTIEDAKANLDYIVCDFPFVGPRDLAAWIAALLTPLARHTFYGPAPWFLFSASTAGTGKTRLVDAIALLVAGRSMSRTAFTADEELRKKLTSMAMAGDPLILLDNLPTTINSPLLDLLLTSTSWTDRLLSLNRIVTLDLRWVIFGTGNNTTPSGDTSRRTVTSYMASPLEDPSSRDSSTFAEPDLLGYIAANRVRLLASALKVLTHYIEAGRPNMRLPGFGSFEAWSDVVRSAVVFAGWADPVTPPGEAEDSAKEMLRSLIAGWREADPNALGMLASEAYERRGQFPTLAAAIDQLPPSNDQARQLGCLLRSQKNRVVDGVAFKKCGTKHKTTLWKVEAAHASDL